MSRAELLKNLTDYVTHTIMGDPKAEVEASTPLLELGILNSLNIAKLMTYLRLNHGVTVPPEEIVGVNFKSLDAVTDMVERLLDAAEDEDDDDD